MTDHLLVERVALLKKLGYSPEKALDAAREDIRHQREAEAKREAEERRQQREAEAKMREAEAKMQEAEAKMREAEAKREAERQQRILTIMQDSNLSSTLRQAALETLGYTRGSFSQGLALTEYFRMSLHALS